MNRPHPLVRDVAIVAAAFAVLAVVFTLPLVLRMRGGLPGDLGDPVLNAWILGWVGDRLGHGGAGLWAGLWDAPIFFPYGSTLAYSENLLGIAVPMAPVLWLTRNPVLVYDLAYLGSYVLAGVGAYVLVRTLGAGRGPAWIAAIAFAFSPYRAAQSVHLQMLMTGWMPLALAALHRYARSGSRAALAAFAACYVVQVLSNGYMLYFLAVPVAVVAIAECLAPAWRARSAGARPPPAASIGIGRRLAELALAAIAIVAALAPVLLVYYRVRTQQGLVRTEREIASFAADLSSIFHAAPGIASARWLPRLAKPEGELFPGLAIAALAILSWLAGRGAASPEAGARAACPSGSDEPLRAIRRRYATIAGLAFGLALGPRPAAWGHPILPTAPYGWLLHVVPGLDGLRVPARLGVVMVLGLAVLAGIGAEALVERVGPRARKAVWIAIGASIVLEGYPGPTPIARIVEIERRFEPKVYRWLAATPPGAVLELPFGDTIARTIGWDLAYQWATLGHRHPTVNGYSGYGSPLSRFLGGPGTPLHEPALTRDWIDMIETLGVRYLVVHQRNEYRDAPGRTSRRLAAIRDALAGRAEERVIGRTSIFMLPESASHDGEGNASAPFGAALPAKSFSVTAVPPAPKVEAMTDGRLPTRFRTALPQHGGERLTVSLRQPRAIAGIELALSPRTAGEYPRALAVTGVAEDGTRSELYRGGVLTEIGRSLVATPEEPGIRLSWPARKLSALEIEQTGRSGCCVWSVNELRVFEAAR